MSANTWGLYRDRNTGRTGFYPEDAAAIFDSLEPIDPTEDECVDCFIVVEEDDYDIEDDDLGLDDYNEEDE